MWSCNIGNYLIKHQSERHITIINININNTNIIKKWILNNNNNNNNNKTNKNNNNNNNNKAPGEHTYLPKKTGIFPGKNC